MSQMEDSINSYKIKKFVSAVYISILSGRNFFKVMTNYKYSKSQLNQDLFALSVILRKRQEFKDVFFVEFGAADGVLHSNTWLLEKLGAQGLLAEPCKSAFQKLTYNRTSILDSRCVFAESRQSIVFQEMTDNQLSKISEIDSSAIRSHKQIILDSYLVETVSLRDLLLEHHVPYNISYLSIDTEGSELQIIEKFNFEIYRFDFISIEHNFRNDRYQIDLLLKLAGYKKVHSRISRFESWYINAHES